tara:strand:+ start:4473 stop:4676 length:204 start_codon:yes stop_codon:yes gene_type:complete
LPNFLKKPKTENIIKINTQELYKKYKNLERENYDLRLYVTRLENQLSAVKDNIYKDNKAISQIFNTK